MGTQIHATENYRRVVELVQGGVIGPVREVHVWVSRAWGLQSREAAERNKDIVFVTIGPEFRPPSLRNPDWDLWLGPAPPRPFNDVYFPGPKWYRWWDFGSGTMSDLGSHWNDLPFWALKLDAPLTIDRRGTAAASGNRSSQHVRNIQYGARGDHAGGEAHLAPGREKPELWKQKGIPQWDSGVLFIGDKGMLLADYAKHLLLPEEKFKDFQRPKPSIPPASAIMRNGFTPAKPAHQQLVASTTAAR